MGLFYLKHLITFLLHFLQRLDNLCSYELFKEFTSEEFNQEITIFDMQEIFESWERQFVAEIVVIASYVFVTFGKARSSVIKVSSLPKQMGGHEIYNYGSASNKVTLKYDWFTGKITATLKDTKVYFKVYVCKFFN